MPDEVRALKTAGELPDSVKLNETEEGGEDNFEFGSGGEEEESDNESDKSDKDDDIDALGRVKGELDEADADVYEMTVPDRRQCRKRHCTSVVNVSNGTAPPCSQNWLEPHPQHGLASTCTPARLVAW